jgi:hypothetical protein
MRMETLVTLANKMCPSCEECDDWILVDEDEERGTFEVACANCNATLEFKVQIVEVEE